MRTIVHDATRAILLLWPLLSANAGRILVITGSPFFSHQTVHRSFSLALHERGHELVVLTSFPMRDRTLKNYTEIDASHILSMIANYNDERWAVSPMESCRKALRAMGDVTAVLFHEPEMKRLYERRSNDKFDAVIVEAVSDLSLFALAHVFDAPLIGIMSMGLHNFHRYIFGSPILPSHSSNSEVGTLVEGIPPFWQRVRNFVDVWSYLYYWASNNVITEQRRFEEYFGTGTPHVLDITKNMSILLVNENSIFAHARPEQPNAIFFSGFHIRQTPPRLPQDLRRFLDDATDGFIYVSLGTTVSCRNLPKEIVGNFVEVFAELPYKIAWKYECEEPSWQLDNVFTSKWFPQQGVLAHPNIRLFIYQGGMQSTEEAVHYGVPLLGIPIVFEQASRVQRLASLGAAIHLKLNELSKERLRTVIHRMLNDKSYKERMAYLSELSRDQPYDSLENAVLWVEYVMRHRGISHLRFSESDKPWYQRYDTDVIAFLATALFIAACVMAFAVLRIFRALFSRTISSEIFVRLCDSQAWKYSPPGAPAAVSNR